MLEPLIVLRRTTGRFFGKILKVNPIVTLRVPPRLPLLPCRASFPAACGRRRPIAACRRVGPAMAAVLLLGAMPAMAQVEPPDPPATGQAGPAESIYLKSGSAVATGADQSGHHQAVQAERIVAASLAMLGRADSVSARLRQRIRVDDRVLVGAGRYVQSGLGEDQRYRYESSMKSDSESFDLLEVCDGLFAWSYKRLGPQPPQLERLDVRRIRERLRQLKVPDETTIVPYLGGIQRTLALLRGWFRFTAVEPLAIDELPVWRVEGRWHPEGLSLLLPNQQAAILQPGGIRAAELPDGMPWSVRLWIGKRDLFPFRIEWLAIPGRRPVADREPEAIAVLELYDVRIGEPVDAAAFVYKPAIEGLIDLTDTHVRNVGPLRP